MNNTTKQLTALQEDMLSELRSEQPYQYHKYNFEPFEQKAIQQLVEAGIVLKTINRIQYQGRYSTKVSLIIVPGWL